MTLRVVVEIVPWGDETRKREIGRLDISNVGDVAPGVCRYRVIETLPDGNTIARPPVARHIRSAGFWELIRKVLVMQPPEGESHG